MIESAKEDIENQEKLESSMEGFKSVELAKRLMCTGKRDKDHADKHWN